jgi:hypothetical protein
LAVRVAARMRIARKRRSGTTRGASASFRETSQKTKALLQKDQDGITFRAAPIFFDLEVWVRRKQNLGEQVARTSKAKGWR